MNADQQFALDRARATKSVQEQIAATWVWEEKTVAQWNTDINAVETQAEAAQDAEADLDLARGNLNVAITNLLTKARQILAIAKIKFRTQENKLNLFRTINLANNGRAKVVDGSLEVESGWEEADAAWEPVTGLTLALFKAERLAATVLVEAESDKEAAWRNQEEIMEMKCRALDGNNVAWYAVATAMFAEGTVEGDLIRSQVPTTYVPPPEEPAQAVLTSAATSGYNAVQLEYTCARATGFNIYHKPQSTPGPLVRIAENIPESVFMHEGIPAGIHEYQVSGVNGAGEGERSPLAEVTVEDEPPPEE